MCDVSIVIVSWNTLSLTRQCLESVRAASGEVATEVLVVDNGSVDGTPELLEREFPEIMLIRSKTNLGFAKANNIAMARASGRYLCLINSDVTVLPGTLRTLTAFLDSNPAVGIVGPRMLTARGETTASCMRRPSLGIWLAHAVGLQNAFPRLSLHIDPRECRSSRPVDVLNGWFWMVRRSALEQVGPLDEDFFMYGEDIEWCGRFRRKGWEVMYFPEAASIHYGGGSSRRHPLRFYLEMQRVRLQYWRRQNNLFSQVAYILIFVLHHSARVVGYAFVCALSPQHHSESWFKVKRSAACLAWLSGIPLGCASIDPALTRNPSL